MKLLIVYFFVFLLSGALGAQEILDIPYSKAPENIKWRNAEENQYSEDWKVNVLVNVSIPQLIFYKPNAAKASGSAVIICPGGGFHGLNMEGEGYSVAAWLAEKGIAAFVLKYRLIPTSGDALKEFAEKRANGTLMAERESFRPLAVADGVSAINYLRENSSSLGIDKSRIGMIGFSSGGTVAMEMVFQTLNTSRPNFIAPIYANLTQFLNMDVPGDAPPLFVCAASDDNFGTVPQCIDIYSRWLEKGLSAEIHMYSKGGHGFGYKNDQNLVNNWINTFGDWLTTIGWLCRP